MFNLRVHYFESFFSGELFIKGSDLNKSIKRYTFVIALVYPGIFFSAWGGSTNSVEDRGRNGDLGAVAP
jgi:hypothetical protein